MAYFGSRDPRFVTVRRGGTLGDDAHRLLALWAADCAEHVLGHFTAARPDDGRPADAIVIARAWADGQVKMTRAREAAYAAHAAARATDGAAQNAARAAGHAVATAHMADHELGGAFYALLAVEAAFPGEPDAVEAERRWQLAALPDGIADLVLDDMRCRARKFKHRFAPPAG